MEYLIVIFFISYLVYVYDIQGTTRYKACSYNFIIILLTLISGLRYRFSIDTIAYMREFENIVQPLSELSLSDFLLTRYQPLWIILNSVAKSLGSFVYLQLICAAFLNYSVGFFYKHSTNKPFTALLLYSLFSFLYFNTDIMRESLAIGAFLIGFVKYEKKQYIYTIFCLIISVLFHVYAFFLFLFMLLVHIVLSLRIKIHILCLSTILVCSFNPYSLIDFLIHIFNIPILYGLLVYVVKNNDTASSQLTVLGLIYLLMKFLFVLLIIIKYKNKLRKYLFIEKKNMIIIVSTYLATILIRIIAIPSIDRICNYFTLFVDLLWIVFLYEFALKFKPVKSRCIILYSCVLFGLLYTTLPMIKIDPMFGVPFYKRYYPYCSVITKRTDPEREIMNYIWINQ